MRSVLLVQALREEVPSLRILTDALWSLSWTHPHLIQTHSRSFKVNESFFHPHSEHSLLEGNHLSTKTIAFPFCLATYWIMLMKDANPKSMIFFWHDFNIDWSSSVSKQRTSYTLVSLWANFQCMSFLWLETFSWSFTRVRFDPLFPLDLLNFRLRRANLFRFFFRNKGIETLFPSLAVRKVFIPKSKPTLLPDVTFSGYDTSSSHTR